MFNKNAIGSSTGTVEATPSVLDSQKYPNRLRSVLDACFDDALSLEESNWLHERDGFVVVWLNYGTLCRDAVGLSRADRQRVP